MSSRRVLFGVLALAIWVGCERGDGADESDGDAAGADSTTAEDVEAVPVEVAVITRGPLEKVLRASATLEAEAQVRVHAEAARRVTAVLVEEGDHVAAGDLLLRLQDDEQQSALAQAETQLAKLESEYQRQKRLHADGLTSDRAYTDARYAFEQQRLAVDDAARALSYTEVRAPIGGTITQRFVRLGDQVQVGQELFEIIDFESLVARVYVPERHLPELRQGLDARVRARVAADAPVRGSVLRISPIVDPSSGTIKITVAVGAQGALRPGMFVDVGIVTAVNDAALLVPKRALVYENDLTFVYRLTGEDTVERVRVEPVLSDTDNVEPRAGFEAGQRVVVAGQAGLKEGARVEVVDLDAVPGADATTGDAPVTDGGDREDATAGVTAESASP